MPWSTGFCGCFPSCFGRCCISFWCPCYTFGQVSEIIDRGTTSCCLNGAIYGLLVGATGCTCFYSMAYRTKMRKQYALDRSAYEDCHCCCQSCALTQEYIELKNCGYDLSLGWGFSRGLALAPVTEPGMQR